MTLIEKRRYWKLMTQMGTKKRRIMALLVATLGVLTSLLLAEGSAYADEVGTGAGARQDIAIPEGATVSQSVLACGEFTGRVLKYAQSHGYCPRGYKALATQAVQNYNCGSSWIYVYNKGYRGKMWTSYGFHSTWGIVVNHNLTVGTTSGIGWSDSRSMWADYYDTERFVGTFSAGSYHAATMSGRIYLVWGGWCTIPPITAAAKL